jgi:hypothetical protein
MAQHVVLQHQPASANSSHLLRTLATLCPHTHTHTTTHTRRKPHLQGRFSGRLATKDDEKRLNTECRLLGPLLGGVGKRGDGSRLTLAKIVRGIAAGEVRKFCEERERAIKVIREAGWCCWPAAALLAGGRLSRETQRGRAARLDLLLLLCAAAVFGGPLLCVLPRPCST